MYSEDDLLPISALQHLAFCERQAALIHVERAWEDNVLTAEGHLLHERADSEVAEMRGNVRVTRRLRLRSLELGLVGMADVVEFNQVESDAAETPGRAAPRAKTSAALPGLPGRWRPFIVEYKHGAPKPDHTDEVQLCAQAMCLEEMLGVQIASSAFFYGRPRRRHQALLSQELREETRKLALRLHEMVRAKWTPPAAYSRRCRRCSLVDVCLPKAARPARKVEAYLRSAISGVDPE